MITEKQRRRALARAKWERQQARRTAAQKRNHRLSIILGAAASVVAVLFVGWGVHYLVTNDDSTSPTTPVIPSNTLTMKTPTNPSFATSFSPPSTTGATSSTGSPTGNPTSTDETGATTQATGTAPATTGATR